MEATEHLRVIVLREADQWVAQCLEYDIGAQAEGLDELHERFMMTLDVERRVSLERNGKAFAGIDPAPKYYHDLWANCAKGFRASERKHIDSDEVDVEMKLCA